MNRASQLHLIKIKNHLHQPLAMIKVAQIIQLLSVAEVHPLQFIGTIVPKRDIINHLVKLVFAGMQTPTTLLVLQANN